MRRVSTMGVAMLFLQAAHGQTVIYVDADAPSGGDGSSWETAHQDLQDGLARARQLQGPGEIWIAEGVYRPDRGSRYRAAPFEIVDGIPLFGGFAGWEDQREQRDWEAHPTVLSGDLNSDDGPDFSNIEDNSIHVVDARVVSAELDGLVISGGFADGDGIREQRGAGVWAAGPGITIRNCVFRSNVAVNSGAAVFAELGHMVMEDCIIETNLNGRYFSDGEGGSVDVLRSRAGGERSVYFARCRFLDNETGDLGAGLSVYDVPTTLENCVFERNHSRNNSGAAHIAYSSSVTVSECVFSDNSARYNAGGLTIGNATTATVSDSIFLRNEVPSGQRGGLSCEALVATIQRCRFEGNSAEGGPGGASILSDDGSFIDCDFIDNSAGWAAAIYCLRGNIRISMCRFQGNISESAGTLLSNANTTITESGFRNNTASDGAAMAFGSSSNVNTHVVSNCSIFDNIAAQDGGAIRVFRANAFILHSDINDNIAGNNGGAISATYADIDIQNCSIVANYAGNDGGAIFTDRSEMAIAQNVISGNVANRNGGAMYFNRVAPRVINCTVIANRALYGGGVYVREYTEPFFRNSIFWWNSDSFGQRVSSQIWYADEIEDPDLANCCIQNWIPTFGGTGINSRNPRFVDLDGRDDIIGTQDADVRLLPNSPCIDAGNNFVLSGLIREDFGGWPRYRDDAGIDDTGIGTPPIVDIGVFEFQEDSCPGDFTGDGVVNIIDFLAFLGAYSFGDSLADLNGDNRITILDFILFLNAFNEGC